MITEKRAATEMMMIEKNGQQLQNDEGNGDRDRTGGRDDADGEEKLMMAIVKRREGEGGGESELR